MSSVFLSSYFLVYESSREVLTRSWPESRGTTHLAAGGLAGCVAAILATPLDTVKTRMQTGAAAAHGAQAAAWSVSGEAVEAVEAAVATRPTIRATVRQLVATHGPMALWRGVGPRIAAFTPAGAITFGSYELYKQWLS